MQPSGPVHMKTVRLLVGLAVVTGTLTLATPARADHHFLNIREIHAGTHVPSADYVVLQALSSAQHSLQNHTLRVFSASGTPVDHTINIDAIDPSGAMTFLIGSATAHSEFHVAVDELEDLDIDPAGGAVCFVSNEGFGLVDCVSWGTFSGSLPQAGAKFNPAGGLSDANFRAIRRKGPSGEQDTNQSANDFEFVDAAPRNDNGDVGELVETTITSGPPAKTGDPSATFTFTSNRAGATFECRLDSIEDADFTACSSGHNTGALGATTHFMDIRAVVGAKKDPSFATHTWTVDLTPPQTQIDSGPSNPTTDTTPTFTFSANESVDHFRCAIDPADSNDYESCESPHTISPPISVFGTHTFKVFAVDVAGNLDPDPAEYGFETVLDITDPETSITQGPPTPSEVQHPNSRSPPTRRAPSCAASTRPSRATSTCASRRSHSTP